VLAYFVAATLLMVLVYFQMKQVQVATLYGVMMVLGFAAGYWAVLMTTSSELFGTNIRATVTTSVPNFIRASLVPISLLYAGLHNMGMLKTQSALVTGIICCGIALWAAVKLPESFHHELDFHEEH
jgi:hypothetical protein